MLKITKELIELSFQCTAFTETGNSKEKWFKLYKCPIGNSGWSYGPIQFDISVSTYGQRCLLECGVEPSDLAILNKAEDAQLIAKAVKRVNRVLRDPGSKAAILDWSYAFIRNGLSKLAALGDVEVEITKLMVLFLMDYHTQFYISNNGKCHRWLRTLDVLTVENFMEYKRTLAWYKKPEGKRDTVRRLKTLKRFAVKQGLWHPAYEIPTLQDEAHAPRIEVEDQLPEWLRL